MAACAAAAVGAPPVGSGAPTEISQRWPGWPCAGFSLGAEAIFIGGAGTCVTGVCTCTWVILGLTGTGFSNKVSVEVAAGEVTIAAGGGATVVVVSSSVDSQAVNAETITKDNMINFFIEFLLFDFLMRWGHQPLRTIIIKTTFFNDNNLKEFKQLVISFKGHSVKVVQYDIIDKVLPFCSYTSIPFYTK